MMVSRLDKLKVPELWRWTRWNSAHEGHKKAERSDGIQPSKRCRGYKHRKEHKFVYGTWYERRRVTGALLTGQHRRDVAEFVHDTQIGISWPCRRSVILAVCRTIDEACNRIERSEQHDSAHNWPE